MSTLRVRDRPSLDAEAATIREHGQLATRGPDGLTVSATKVIREGFRARVLLVPRLLRIELELEEDTVHSRIRGLSGTRLAWLSMAQTDRLISAADSFGPQQPCVMRSALTLNRGLTSARATLTLVVTPLDDWSASRIVARADIVPSTAVAAQALAAYAPRSLAAAEDQ